MRPHQFERVTLGGLIRSVAVLYWVEGHQGDSLWRVRWDVLRLQDFESTVWGQCLPQAFSAKAQFFNCRVFVVEEGIRSSHARVTAASKTTPAPLSRFMTQ